MDGGGSSGTRVVKSGPLVCSKCTEVTDQKLCGLLQFCGSKHAVGALGDIGPLANTQCIHRGGEVPSLAVKQV